MMQACVAALLPQFCMGIENNTAPVVLLVDDDEDLLNIVDQILQAEGFQTVLSLNGEKLREIITLNRPDIILLDIHMQGINGGDICREIKNDPNTVGIPLLLFSANDNIKTITNECGADGYITKPLEIEVLISTIQYFLKKSGMNRNQFPFELPL